MTLTSKMIIIFQAHTSPSLPPTNKLINLGNYNNLKSMKNKSNNPNKNGEKETIKTQ
jgi:hypothetical protein